METKEQKKPEFGPESLKGFIEQVNTKFPAELLSDWRSYVKKQFHMSPEQEASITHIPEETIKEIQNYFNKSEHHIRAGSKLHGKIVKRAAEKQTATAVHEVHLNIDSPKPTPQLSIVVAHCDSSCRHWGWGPG